MSIHIRAASGRRSCRRCRRKIIAAELCFQHLSVRWRAGVRALESRSYFVHMACVRTTDFCCQNAKEEFNDARYQQRT